MTKTFTQHKDCNEIDEEYILPLHILVWNSRCTRRIIERNHGISVKCDWSLVRTLPLADIFANFSLYGMSISPSKLYFHFLCTEQRFMQIKYTYIMYPRICIGLNHSILVNYDQSLKLMRYNIKNLGI